MIMMRPQLKLDCTQQSDLSCLATSAIESIRFAYSYSVSCAMCFLFSPRLVTGNLFSSKFQRFHFRAVLWTGFFLHSLSELSLLSSTCALCH